MIIIRSSGSHDVDTTRSSGRWRKTSVPRRSSSTADRYCGATSPGRFCTTNSDGENRADQNNNTAGRVTTREYVRYSAHGFYWGVVKRVFQTIKTRFSHYYVRDWPWRVGQRLRCDGLTADNIFSETVLYFCRREKEKQQRRRRRQQLRRRRSTDIAKTAVADGALPITYYARDTGPRPEAKTSAGVSPRDLSASVRLSARRTRTTTIPQWLLSPGIIRRYVRFEFKID